MRFGKPTKNTRKNNPRYFTITEDLAVENNSNKNMHDVQVYLEEFYPFAKKVLGFEQDATVIFESDLKNSKDPLGKTAYYDPSSSTVTVFVDDRHPKDVMRSVAHELVHHHQNSRGDFQGAAMEEGYAQNDDHLREMEREAYEKGNLLFRDWTDHKKNGNNDGVLMDRIMEKWGFGGGNLQEDGGGFEKDQLINVVASALAVDGVKRGVVVDYADPVVTIKLDDDQEGKYVPEDKMVKVKKDYVEPRVDAGPADVMGESPGVNEMYDDDYDEFDMDSLEDEFPWLAKSVKSKEVPAELAAELAAEFGDKEESEEEEDASFEKDALDASQPMAEEEQSKKDFVKSVMDKGKVPNLKGDMDEIPGMEGPFQFKSGAVLYYDTKTGEYYDRGKDMYLDRDEAAELTMEGGAGFEDRLNKFNKQNKAQSKKAAWMKAYNDAAGNPQPPPQDFWDTATHLYNRGDDPYEAGNSYAARSERDQGAEDPMDDFNYQGSSHHYQESINEGQKTWAEYGTDDAQKGRPPSPPAPGGLSPDKREWHEYMDAYKAVSGETVGGSIGAHMDEGIEDESGWGEIHGNASEEAPSKDAAVNALSKLDKTIESYLQNVDKSPQYEADARDLQEIRGMFWQEFKNGATPGNFSQELKDAVANLDTIVRDEIPQDLYYSLHPEILENKEMNLEEIVRQAIRATLKEGDYRREDDEEEEMDEMKYRREDGSGECGEEEEELTVMKEGEYVGHHIEIDGSYHVDSNFLNSVRQIRDTFPGELKHLGFGEFYLETPEGKIDFDRTRGQDFEGMVGRSHKLYSSPPELADQLIDAMEQAGASETPLPAEEAPPGMEQELAEAGDVPKEMDPDQDGDIDAKDLAALRSGKEAADDKDEETKINENTSNKEWYDSQLFGNLMKKWAKQRLTSYGRCVKTMSVLIQTPCAAACIALYQTKVVYGFVYL